MSIMCTSDAQFQLRTSDTWSEREDKRLQKVNLGSNTRAYGGSEKWS